MDGHVQTMRGVPLVDADGALGGQSGVLDRVAYQRGIAVKTLAPRQAHGSGQNFRDR